MNIFTAAWRGLNLSPLARAILKLCEGVLASALVAALPALAPLLAGQPVNWQVVGQVFASAASVAVLLAVKKYVAAQGDAPLTDASADTRSMQAATPIVRVGANTPVMPVS